MKLCEKLHKIRKDNNITQEGLADKLNVSRQAVSKWESGQAYPDTEKLIQISKIFNVSLDELINDNCDKSINSSDKKLDLMSIINKVLEFISKSVNMFWSMKFVEKIKLLFEMAILILIISGVVMLSVSIMVNIFRRIFIFLPDGIVYNLCSLFETLLFIVWIIVGFLIVIKIFKSRYLDYYIVVCDDSVSEKMVEEPIKELKEMKEYKVVIRDPKDSSLNIFRKIWKIFIFMTKILCFLICVPLVLCFIFCVLLLVFSLFYLFDGLFFNGITLAIIGIIIFLYLLIEFIYNLLFNRTHALNRIFIMFIGSISLIGIGLGLSFVAISRFKITQNEKVEVNAHMIEMSDDLVITSMIYDMGFEDVIIDNNLDNIKLEVISYGECKSYLYSYESYDPKVGNFRVVDVNFEYNELDLYRDIIDNLKDGKIVNYNEIYDVKMYISKDNLNRLRENINRWSGEIIFE